MLIIYNIEFLLFRASAYTIECIQLLTFFYITFAVLVKYRDVTVGIFITALKNVSEFTTSAPCGCIS